MRRYHKFMLYRLHLYLVAIYSEGRFAFEVPLHIYHPHMYCTSDGEKASIGRAGQVAFKTYRPLKLSVDQPGKIVESFHLILDGRT